MDSFKKHYDDFPFGFPLNTKARHLYTWQEAAKQRDAEYTQMAEHTELSIREDAWVGGVRYEHERTVKMIKKIVNGPRCCLKTLKILLDRIEKDSK